MPFGRDQLTSVFANSFIDRSLIGSQLSPGRDIGAVVHGRLGGGKVNYSGGWFDSDGDNVRFSEDLEANEFEEAPVDGLIAGRVEFSPGRRRGGWRGGMHFGLNTTIGDVATGLFGLRGRMTDDFVFFDPVYVSGRRLRLGVDGLWTPGPFSVQAEYNRLTDQRNGQGLGDVDLPDVIAQGWYLAGTWVLTGERKAGGIEPGIPSCKDGAGRFEVAARIRGAAVQQRRNGRRAAVHESARRQHPSEPRSGADARRQLVLQPVRADRVQRRAGDDPGPAAQPAARSDHVLERHLAAAIRDVGGKSSRAACRGRRR